VSDIDAAVRRRGNRGAYVLAETRLGQIGTAPVESWIRVGIADGRFNAIGTYVGGGVTVGPDKCKFGVAVAHARLGERSQLAGTARAETVIEWTYAHAISDRLTIQPDVQLVINPGFDSTLRNSLSGGVRLQLAVF
jgi:porin